MKIFNRENNKLVAYIQIKNIKALIKYEEKLPKKMYKLAKKLNISNQNEEQDEEFIRITNKKIINILLNTDWIPDYRELRDLTEEELQIKIEELATKIQEKNAYYKDLSTQEKTKHSFLISQCQKGNQTLKDINTYLLTKQNKICKNIDLPLMIDSQEGIIESNGAIRAGRSIDGKYILIENKNGKPCINYDPDEIKPAIFFLINEYNLSSNKLNEVSINIQPDQTKHFLIIDLSHTQNIIDKHAQQKTKKDEN